MPPSNPFFSHETVEFLFDLTANNNRDWFAVNKKRYAATVQEPALALIRVMQPHLASFAPRFVASDKKIGGSLMRVQRDTRFSSNKTPYKTNIGIQFRHEAGKDVHAPGYYLHFSLDECFVGVGLWQPPAEPLAQIRRRIAIDDPTGGPAWQAARDDARFCSHFSLAGDSLKRPPKGFAADHPLIEDIKRKDFIAMSSYSPAEATGGQFVALIAERFAAATPLMRFLCQAVKVSF